MSVPVQKLAAPRPLEAKITLRVGEEGGRAVERSVTLPILPEGPVVGVRKNFGGDLAEGATATFDVVMAAPDGTRQARQGVAWNLYRVERRYQWFNSDGRWGFEPVKSTKRVADGRIDVSAAEPARIATPVEWGSYRLDVRVDGVESAQTSVSFTVGWGGDQTADVPDLLDMTLDKASYGLGEEIRARLSPRFAGKATLAVVSDKVHDLKVVDVAADGTTVTLPVKAEWGAGAYLVALAHRPLDAQAKRMPGRSLGLAWFEVDRSARTLKVEVAAPAQMRPRGEMRLPIKVAGLNPGEEARVTVAAVDVGILNLTRYKTPDPVEYFFGQKQLSTELRDLYGYLIDGMQGTRGAIRSGGDDAGGVQGIPPVQDPLARYSGVVKVGPDGTAEVAFDIPAFNGTVRVMAVAWSATRVGSASADVIVRDPVVVDRHAAALPVGRRPVALPHAGRERRGAGRRLHPRRRRPRAGGAAGRRLAQDLPARRRRQDAGDDPGDGGRTGACRRRREAHRPEHRGLAELPRRRPARHLLARAPHRAAARGRREPHRVERPLGRHPARHRRGVGLGIAARRARRAGAAAGARPLPLWLLRADRQPGAALALRQQARGDGGAGARYPARRAGARCDRARARAPGLRTAPSACGRSAATTCGSTPMSPIS